MEDALAGTNSERAAGSHLGRLGLPAVLVAPDVRARGSTRDKVVALRVLDLTHVLPFDCVLARACDQIGKVVYSWSATLFESESERTVGLHLSRSGQEQCKIKDAHLGEITPKQGLGGIGSVLATDRRAQACCWTGGTPLYKIVCEHPTIPRHPQPQQASDLKQLPGAIQALSNRRAHGMGREVEGKPALIYLPRNSLYAVASQMDIDDMPYICLRSQ